MSAANDASSSSQPTRPRKEKKKRKLKHAARPDRSAAGEEPEPDADAEPEPEQSDDIPWGWTPLADPSAASFPPLFTKDGSYFFSVVGFAIKIHSTQTGEVVSTLSASESARGHVKPVTAAILHPTNPFQLITSSLDGCIKVWDFLDAILLQTFQLQGPIVALCAHESLPDHVFAAVAKSEPLHGKSSSLESSGAPGFRKGVEYQKGSEQRDAKEDSAVYRVSLLPDPATVGHPVQRPSETRIVGKTRDVRGLAVSPSGEWLVAIGGHKVYVACLVGWPTKRKWTKLVSPSAPTCLAFHPNEDYFATGDEDGKIRFWYCLNEESLEKEKGVEKRGQTTVLHWHAHAVSSLAFTSNGAYLLSGGEEAVLVVWQVHSGKKEFVPRVGAPISALTVRPAGEREEEYLLALADSTFVMISAGSLKISRSFTSLKLAPSVSSDHAVSSSTPAVLAVHPQSSSLILGSSHPSSIQIYSPSTSKVIAELEVAPSNRVSRRDDEALRPSRVEHVALSPSGHWLATVDAREGDDTFRGEIYLKIWRWDRKSGYWILNTRIDRPHGLNAITHVAFSPSSDERLVTTGGDDSVRIWGIRNVTNKETGKEDDFWIKRSTLAFRSARPSHASWSPDGSLLAIAYGAHVVIYEAATNAIQATVACPGYPVLTAVHFLGRSARHIALVAGFGVVLWDLLQRTVAGQHHWTSLINRVIPHASEDACAIFSSSHAGTTIDVISASSVPSCQTRSLPFRLRAAAWTLTATSSPTTFDFFGITDDWNVVAFGDTAVRAAGASVTGAPLAREGTSERSRTLFEDIFGSSAFSPATASSTSVVPPEVRRPHKEAEVASIFDAPTYLMPPLNTLYDRIMGSFLSTRSDDIQHQSVGDAEASETNGGDSMDVEEENAPATVPMTMYSVEQEEMDELVHLFRAHAFQSASSPATPLRRPPNGLASVNGLNHGPLPNGKATLPRVEKTSKLANVTPQKPSPKMASIATPNDSPASTPTVRKRKKLMPS